MKKQEEKIEETRDETLDQAEEKDQEDAREQPDMEAGEEAGEQETEAEEEPEFTEVEKAQREASEAKDKYLRLYSEFENFRRRTAKERTDMVASAGRDIMKELLPILDDFERAVQSADDEKATIASVKEGMELIHHKLNKTLSAKGLKRMEVKKGDAFDDDYHEAITQIPADTDLEGKIVDVIEPGYFLNDKVIRFAKVVTGAKQ